MAQQTEQTNETAAEIDLEYSAQDVREPTKEDLKQMDMDFYGISNDKAYSIIQNLNEHLSRFNEFISAARYILAAKQQDKTPNTTTSKIPHIPALSVLKNIHSNYQELVKDKSADWTIKVLSFLYFFAKKQNKSTDYSAPLNDTDTEEIKAIFSRLDSYYCQHNGEADTAMLFFRFVDNDCKTEEVQSVIAKLPIPNVIAKLPKYLTYPLDKVNSHIWSAPAEEQQGITDYLTGSNESGKEAIVSFSINFDELGDALTITKHLTPFDKRCYIAISSLYACGNEIMSATQIHSAMGRSKKPSSIDIEKINASLTKMGYARVCIDNSKETSLFKNYELFCCDEPLLSFQRITAYKNDKLCIAIRLQAPPPLINFAIKRKQITTIAKELLDSPLSMTDENLRIEHYLIERIAQIKGGKRKSSNKMLYATIFKKCEIKDRKQKLRAREKIEKLLNHYQACEFIKSHTENEEAITILC